jgi:hypothetical protein
MECRLQAVEHLKEHGDKWKLNEELESPAVEAHSTPSSFTEAHEHKNGPMNLKTRTKAEHHSRNTVDRFPNYLIFLDFGPGAILTW